MRHTEDQEGRVESVGERREERREKRERKRPREKVDPCQSRGVSGRRRRRQLEKELVRKSYLYQTFDPS